MNTATSDHSCYFPRGANIIQLFPIGSLCPGESNWNMQPSKWSLTPGGGKMRGKVVGSVVTPCTTLD